MTSRATADAAAATSRATADAAAVTSRATADAAAVTSRATADAAVVTLRATAYAAAVTSRATKDAVAAAALAAALVYLVFDLHTHEDPDYISWRVRRALLASATPGASQPAEELVLPVPQQPLALDFLPLMLVGPMGCGKSTLLERTRSEAAAARVPVVLVRWRLSVGSKGGAAAYGAIPSPADDSLSLASDALFQQIGFPPRRALIVSALKSGVQLLGLRTQTDLPQSETRDRLLFALRVLFKAAADVQAARIAAGATRFDAAPLLLFDEAHDLIEDERLARAGGAAVFKHLALLIIGYCVDRRAVRAIVGGSSAELDAAFMTSAPYGNRWRHFELMDPAPDVTSAALEARGYAPSEARALIGECGTRLCLLQSPLQGGKDAVGAAGFIAASVSAGDKAVAALFGGLATTDASALARTLDAIAAVDGAAEGVGAPRPLVKELPAAARATGNALTSVVYADVRGRAFFQSRPVALAWARARGPLRAKLQW